MVHRLVALVCVTLVASMTSTAGAQPSAAAGRTTSFAFFDSEAGEWVGGGIAQLFPTVTYNGLRGGYPTFVVANSTRSFQVWFAAPAGQPLVPGTYEGAERFDVRSAGRPGLDAFGDGRGCNAVSGRFIVDEASYDASGAVASFRARFEEHCEGGTRALFGGLAYEAVSGLPVRSVAPNGVDFGVVDVGSPFDRNVTITDEFGGMTSPTNLHLTGANASEFQIVSSTCPQPPATYQSCWLTLRFSPTGSGTRSATLAFTDELSPLGPAGAPDTSGTGRDIPITGVGRVNDPPDPGGGPPGGGPTGGGGSTGGSGFSGRVEVSRIAIDFGLVRVATVSHAETTTLINNTSASVVVHAVDVEGPQADDFFGFTDCLDSNADGSTRSRTLPAGGTCRIAHAVIPLASGRRSASLVLRTSGGEQSVRLSASGTTGYYIAGAAGDVAAFGDALDFGDLSGQRLNAPIVGLASPTPGDGYWLLGRDGGIFSFGDATFYGSTGNLRLNQPVIGMAPTVTGEGYWLVARDGGIFAFGDAGFYGSTGSLRLNQPIVGMTSTPSGNGYWLVASDGGLFAFGDAAFLGSTGDMRLNRPVVGMASTPTGLGYLLVADDGGVFAFGDAGFHGSTGNVALKRPINGLQLSPTGRGYWMVASDGGIFNFGDAEFHGSLGGQGITDVIGLAGTAPPVPPALAGL